MSRRLMGMGSGAKIAEKVNHLRDKALAAARENKWEGAARYYVELVELVPEDGEWSRRASDCFLRLGKESERLRYALLAATSYSESGLLLKAIAMCKVVLSIDPTNTGAMERMSRLHARRPVRVEEPVGGRVRARVAAREPRQKAALGRVQLKAARRPPEPSRRAQKERARHAANAALREIRARRAAVTEESCATRVADARRDPTIPPPGEPIGVQVQAAPSPAERSLSPPALRASTSVSDVDPTGKTHHALSQPPSHLPLQALLLSERVPAETRDSVPPSRGSVYSLALSEVPQAELRAAKLPDLALPVSLPPEPESLAVLPTESLAPQEIPTSPPPQDAPSFAEAAFENTPLLSQLSAETLRRLIEKVDLVELSASEVLFEEGTIADAMYVVVDGEVAAVSRVEGTEVQLATLSDGEFFGEIGLLSDQPRQASVRACERTRLLRFDRQTVSSLIEGSEDFLAVLLRFIQDRLVEDLMLTSPLFTPLSEDARGSLEEMFEFLEVEPDTVLLDEGQPALGMYVLLTGEALQGAKAGGARLVRLGPGAIFGQRALLGNEASRVQVRTLSKCFALCLPCDCFREVILTHPTVLEYVSGQREALRDVPPELSDLGDHVSFF